VTVLGFLAAAIVMAVGSVLQGSIGFGLALFAAPILALIDPHLAPGPLLVANLCLTLLMARREWHAVQLRHLGWALGGRVVGIVIAIAIMARLSAANLELLFGGLVLFAVLITAAGVAFRLSPGTLAGAGVVSGVTGTATGIGGPPMALVYQRETGPEIRGTLSAYFTVGAVLSALGLWWVDKFGMAELISGLLLCPGVLLGYLASHRFLPVMDRRGLRPAILGLSAVSAAILILRRVF
jgi:uncharacterized membrane protein YfcA